jgi:tetratricopeptide (TPR) repeat protein
MKMPATSEPATSEPAQPYVGLRAFRAEDRPVFFGRSRESLDLARIWRSNKLTVLYGASGVGKTSLLQAGVMPVIDRSQYDVLPAGRLQSGLPVGTGAPDPGGRDLFTFPLLQSWAPNVAAESLAGLSIGGFFGRRAPRQDVYGDLIPTLIAIDQAEELFGALPLRRRALDEFVAELAEALDRFPGLRLLLSLREDYLAAMIPYEYQLGGQARMRSRLMPFDPATALEAIREPAQCAGASFEDGAAEEIVAELRTVKVTNVHGDHSTISVDAIEPGSVQIVCSELWNSLPQGTRRITQSDVQRYANVDKSLASFFSRALAEVAAEQQIPAARIREWLSETFITEHGTRGTAYQGLRETAGMSNQVVRALEDRRILRAEHRSGIRWYELQHDRLIEPVWQADAREQLTAAELARDTGKWDLARTYALQAIRFAFGDDELRLRGDAERLLGDVCADLGEIDEALERYQIAAGLHEVWGDQLAVGQSLAALGQLLMSRGDYLAAMDHLSAAAARVEGVLAIQVQIDLARAMWFTGEPQVALTVITNLLSGNGDELLALRLRGEILADLGDSAGALRDLDRVRRNQTPDTIAARALALALAGRFEAADQEAADARANGDASGPALLRVARVLSLRGNAAEAAAVAGQALVAREPALPRHFVKEARLLAKPGVS